MILEMIPIILASMSLAINLVVTIFGRKDVSNGIWFLNLMCIPVNLCTIAFMISVISG